MRNRIRLDTLKDVTDFITITNTLTSKVRVTNGEGFTVSGKSYLGLVYASAEFENLYVESEDDIYEKIERFIII